MARLTRVTDWLVKWKSSLTGAVERLLHDKLDDVLHVKDFGVVGDGSDETAKLQAAFNAAAGKTLILGEGKVYTFNPDVGLTIAAPITLVSNSSSFKESKVNSSFGITITASDVNIDNLTLYVLGGPNEKGIKITGNDVTIGRIEVISPTAGTGAYSSQYIALQLGPDSGKSSNVNVGNIKASNWDRPVLLQNLQNAEIGHIECTSYVRGVYIKDCDHLVILGGLCKTISPNSAGGAGENAILMESVSGSGVCNNIRINNFSSEDSGEHGFRLGGQLTIFNVWFTNCSSLRSGSAITVNNPIATEWHGGCGFKVLGGTTVTGQPHRNIYFDNCSVEDCNVTPGAFPVGHGHGNFSGFQFVVAEHIHMNNCSVKDLNQTYSCGYGCEILASRHVYISDCSFLACASRAIRIYESNDTVNPGWNIPSQHIYINDCELHAVIDAVIAVQGNIENHNHVHMKGINCRGAVYAVRLETPTTGSYRNFSIEFEYAEGGQDPATSTNHVVFGTADVVLNAKAQWNPLATAQPQAANGSLWQDTYGGIPRAKLLNNWRRILTQDALSENSSAANLGLATSTINTVDKYRGKLVYDGTSTKLYRAMDGSPTSAWRAVDGSGGITPA